MKSIFNKADILIPKDIASFHAWSVIACDQYTSEPDYWIQVANKRDNLPSTYHLIYPEIYLNQPSFEEKIKSINLTMENYLKTGVFARLPQSLIYLERTMQDGSIRQGIVGAIDLECYDYVKGSEPPVRATEGTVLDRIPPRVKIRENAPLEIPHIMLLIDDETTSIIENVKSGLSQKLYDFDLAENGGHIKGWLVENESAQSFLSAINALQEPEFFEKKYPFASSSKSPLAFAAGDGNHSLATAKKSYESLKQSIGETAARQSNARYALCEVVNLHSPALKFEAIHRVLFDCDYHDLHRAMKNHFSSWGFGCDEGKDARAFEFVQNDKITRISLSNPPYNLCVACLDDFLEEYAKENSLKIDYIHGRDVVLDLCKSGKNAGFILPCINKSDLFKTVILDGALPRKTFSMGRSNEKRYYLECREIK